MTVSLSLDVHMDTTYEDAMGKVKAALKDEGFGVLTEVDVRVALKEKIGVDFRPYAIIGACNPQLAYQALSHAPEIGLMLPCNVTVEQDPDVGITVRIIDPVTMMASAGLGDDVELGKIANQAREKLQRVADVLTSASRDASAAGRVTP